MTIVGNCPHDNFTDGITNGAEWYPVTGGMQDYNYIYAGCLEVTLEVSCCKFPNASELQRHWEADRDPLLLYLMQINMGVRGIVRDQHNNPVEGAVISIQGRELIKSKTTSQGEYWKLLLPGHYRLLVSTSGCDPKVVPFEVVNGTVTRLDVTIDRQAGGLSGVASSPQSPPFVLGLFAFLVFFHASA
ncbi:hypothetical protein BaRGS_00006872 [Batillaria attramentaria]|uniref:Peptidase M14 domain-containing protein n=1 Tax=Batillaria attramentaria TaxID=370345 RepID=A0ABD0LRK0_9CAEN